MEGGKKMLVSKVALIGLVIALAAQMKGSMGQGSCPTELANLNVCAPFVLPGTSNPSPSPQCCGALQAVDHDCLCNTLRIASRLPSSCSLPPVSCGN